MLPSAQCTRLWHGIGDSRNTRMDMFTVSFQVCKNRKLQHRCAKAKQKRTTLTILPQTYTKPAVCNSTKTYFTLGKGDPSSISKNNRISHSIHLRTTPHTMRRAQEPQSRCSTEKIQDGPACFKRQSQNLQQATTKQVCETRTSSPRCVNRLSEDTSHHLDHKSFTCFEHIFGQLR